MLAAASEQFAPARLVAAGEAISSRMKKNTREKTAPSETSSVPLDALAFLSEA
jgi:hypothetical protein